MSVFLYAIFVNFRRDDLGTCFLDVVHINKAPSLEH